MNKHLLLNIAFLGSVQLFTMSNALADVPLTPAQFAKAKTENFEKKVLLSNLNKPHALVWGPDNQIWLTELVTGKILRVNPETGAVKTVFQVPGIINDPHAQNGLLGFAFHPDFKNNPYIYISGTFKNPQATDKNSPNQTIIRRYIYNKSTDTLQNPVDLLAGLPSSKDHQAGRLVIGPDHKIYYTLGDQGHNQLTYLFEPNYAQSLPTQQELKNKDFHAYSGKVLRLNLDGSIPRDNPSFNGVTSHVYTLGHRNPQGLAFAPNGKLLQAEQGPNSDDEINLVVKGGNYGWPNVAGYKDDSGYAYANYSAATNKSQIKDLGHNGIKVAAGVPVTKESEWTGKNFIAPLKTLFTVQDTYNYNDPMCGDMTYICWPTVAPSSAYVYTGGKKAIPGWENTLLVPSLKRGVIFRIKMDQTYSTTYDDAIPMFKSNNRYRDVIANPEGNTLYVLTDPEGNVQKDDGSVTNQLENPGALIKFTYKAK
ncbi:TPA: glucose/sorbosone family PQQ-dependent dehydrogenase [Acinetobacter baumannii]